MLIEALMLPPMVEATCVSANTFAAAAELTTAIEERDEESPNPGSETRRHLSADISLPKTGEISPHDRRYVNEKGCMIYVGRSPQHSV